ncbi:MAG: hypothetical protein V8Q89_03075 [Christensenellales bacterium]
MMNKKVFVKLIALLMAAAMLLGVCACSATDNNPTIGKIGKVKITLSQYQQIYQQYSYYANSMDDFNGFIKNQLITYGVTLNKCYELGLDKEISQDELQKNVDAKLDQAIASYKVDASITDEAAIRENKLDQFKAALKKQGTSYKAYMKSLKQSELESMMMEMLQEKIYSEVQFDASAFEKYISENTLSQRDNYGKDVSAFMTAYNSYISGSGMIPLYTPNDMFTVKHLLVQYDNSDKVSDTVEGVFTDEQNKKLDEIRKALESGISLDEFVDKYVTNGDYQSDTVFVSATPDPSATPNPDATPEPTADPDSPGGYKEHGYIMNENLLSKYFDGFGAAACLLFYGDDWKIPAESASPAPDATDAPKTTDAPVTDVPATTDVPSTDAPATTDVPSTDAPATTDVASTDAPATDAPATDAPTTDKPADDETDPVKKYGIKIYTTTDGQKIAEVTTKTSGGGVHFIFINERLDAGDTVIKAENDDAAYRNAKKFYIEKTEQDHYSECFTEWKNNTKIRMNDKYIDTYAKQFLGIA